MAQRNLLRIRNSAEGSNVGEVELLFDLVFVFAITQLSHGLLGQLDALGAARMGLLFVSVWTVWIFTTWCTNWVSPNRMPVRLMLFAVMLLGLVMSAAIPDAFGARGWAYGGAVAAIQVGRSVFMLVALRRHSPANYRNFLRITAWLAVAAVGWVWGGWGPPAQRMAVWGMAMAVELIGPPTGFWTPGLGRSTTRDWDVSGHHMAERCGLIVIIALGEMIMMTGATFATTGWDGAQMAAFAGATLGAIAMWWIYFNIGAERATHLIAHSADPGKIARLAYTYLHMPIVGSIVVSAVATELIITHPHAPVDPGLAWAAIGSGAGYLVGNALFKRATAERTPVSHLAGLAGFAALGLMWRGCSALELGLAGAGLMVLVAAWETGSLRSYQAAREEMLGEAGKAL